MPSDLQQKDHFKMNKTSQTVTNLKLGTSEKTLNLKYLATEDSI